jgi:hypothetical protein
MAAGYRNTKRRKVEDAHLSFRYENPFVHHTTHSISTVEAGCITTVKETRPIYKPPPMPVVIEEIAPQLTAKADTTMEASTQEAGGTQVLNLSRT